MNQPISRWRGSFVLAALFLLSCGREAPVGTVAVVSDPPGAAVIVDGDSTGSHTPVDLLLGAGPHTFAVRLPDHEAVPATRSLTVAPAQRLTASFALTGMGWLAVASDPAGGAIVLDGEPTGRNTPDTLRVAAGEHVVGVVAGGLVAEEGQTTVTVATGDVAEVAFTLVPAATLRITSAPVDATVILDGETTERTTPALFVLPARRHVVRVLREGWNAEPDSQVVDLVAGADTTLVFQLTETGQTGMLRVASVPPGAVVLVDGEETNRTTPAAIDLPGGTHSVSVRHPLFRPVPPVVVEVVAGETVDQGFVLSARRVALVETFSSVNCVGCPQMNTMLERVVTEGGFGRDRLLAVKFSQGWLGPDPHYAANPADNDARAQFYWGNTSWDGALPTLFLDGVLSVAPERTNGYPPYDEMIALLDASGAADPGFAIQVDVPDFSAPRITATVTLLTATPPTGTEDPELDVVLVESPVHYDEPPGSEGETEFHWIMRDVVRLADATLAFDPAAPDTHTVQFTNDATWVDDHLLVVAFVQDRGTLAILQAGSAAAADAAPSRSASPAPAPADEVTR